MSYHYDGVQSKIDHHHDDAVDHKSDKVESHKDTNNILLLPSIIEKLIITMILQDDPSNGESIKNALILGRVSKRWLRHTSSIFTQQYYLKIDIISLSSSSMTKTVTISEGEEDNKIESNQETILERNLKSPYCILYPCPHRIGILLKTNHQRQLSPNLFKYVKRLLSSKSFSEIDSLTLDIFTTNNSMIIDDLLDALTPIIQHGHQLSKLNIEGIYYNQLCKFFMPVASSLSKLLCIDISIHTPPPSPTSPLSPATEEADRSGVQDLLYGTRDTLQYLHIGMLNPNFFHSLLSWPNIAFKSLQLINFFDVDQSKIPWKQFPNAFPNLCQMGLGNQDFTKTVSPELADYLTKCQVEFMSPVVLLQQTLPLIAGLPKSLSLSIDMESRKTRITPDGISSEHIVKYHPNLERLSVNCRINFFEYNIFKNLPTESLTNIRLVIPSSMIDFITRALPSLSVLSQLSLFCLKKGKKEQEEISLAIPSLFQTIGESKSLTVVEFVFFCDIFPQYVTNNIVPMIKSLHTLQRFKTSKCQFTDPFILDHFNVQYDHSITTLTKI